MRPKSKTSCPAPTAASVEVLGANDPVLCTGVPPMRGMATSRTPTYEAVLLFVVPSNACAVAPKVGSHCARAMRVSAAAAATRASALCSDG